MNLCSSQNLTFYCTDVWANIWKDEAGLYHTRCCKKQNKTKQKIVPDLKDSQAGYKSLITLELQTLGLAAQHLLSQDLQPGRSQLAAWAPQAVMGPAGTCCYPTAGYQRDMRQEGFSKSSGRTKDHP